MIIMSGADQKLLDRQVRNGVIHFQHIKSCRFSPYAYSKKKAE